MSKEMPRVKRHMLMSEAEAAFLARYISPEHTVWEWGAGVSTAWLAQRARNVWAVEHDRNWAVEVLSFAPPNAAVLWVPPDLPIDSDVDGDRESFRRYVMAYTGKGIDVVLVDGRARVDCLHQVAELAEYGPDPKMSVFLHDSLRPEYAALSLWWRVAECVESMARLVRR